MPSASLQPSVINQYLFLEREKGRVADPFPNTIIVQIFSLRLILFGDSVSFSLAVALHLSELFWRWQATCTIFVDQVSGLYSFSRRAGHPLSSSFDLCFCNSPYRQLAFLRSSQVTALESVLELRLLRKAVLSTSTRPWDVGQGYLLYVHTLIDTILSVAGRIT